MSGKKASQREAKLTTFGLAQQTDVRYWDWSDNDKAAIGCPQAMANVVRQRMEQMHPNVELVELYVIVHDKDVRRVWDTTAGAYITVVKERHVHMVGKFAGEGLLLKDIARAVGIEPQYIERPKPGRYGYDNMLSYMIHAKDAEKFQYSPEEVVTAAGREYVQVYNERKESWEKGAAVKTRGRAKEDIEHLIQRILKGEVTEQMLVLDDDLYTVYAQYPVRCDQALATYAKRKAHKAIRAMENGEFKIAVFYITGAPGAGKSMFTDRMVNELVTYAREELGEEWQKCAVAASNPLDDWNGEEILVMDDLRGMAMTASDWLKLLDPDRVNRAGTRYRNKLVAPRAIFINAHKDVCDFFYYLKGNGGLDKSEAMDQFIRRITDRVYVMHAPDARNSERRLVNVQPMYRLEEGTTERIEVGDEGATVELHYGFRDYDEWVYPVAAADIIIGRVFGVKMEEEDDGEVD